jgi:tetratricopeptide (TPR) repeat protein
MIDNFDHLVKRCVAKRRKIMIRRSLFITSAILFVIALITGYKALFFTPNVTVVAPKVVVPPRVQTPKEVTPPIDQRPIALPKIAPIPKEKGEQDSTILLQEGSKTPLYVLQLTSNNSYESVRKHLATIPKQYQTGMKIYLVNNYYTLRYIEIFDASRIVPLINEFKNLGFEKPTLFKYNPDRIPLTDKMAALIASTHAPTTIPTVQSTPPTIQTPPPPRSTTGAIFSVTNTPKVPDANPIGTFKQNPTYGSAIVIARDYYGKNNFSEAAFWAKKANQLNREEEEAWLLYAKSYWAQGRKKEAVGVLELYMNYKDSKAASELYRTWKSSSSN